MRYLPFSKYKYYIKDKTEDLTTALEKEYQARLNGYTSQKTLLSPSSTIEMGLKQVNIRSFITITQNTKLS